MPVRNTEGHRRVLPRTPGRPQVIVYDRRRNHQHPTTLRATTGPPPPGQPAAGIRPVPPGQRMRQLPPQHNLRNRRLPKRMVYPRRRSRRNLLCLLHRQQPHHRDPHRNVRVRQRLMQLPVVRQHDRAPRILETPRSEQFPRVHRNHRRGHLLIRTPRRPSRKSP